MTAALTMVSSPFVALPMHSHHSTSSCLQMPSLKSQYHADLELCPVTAILNWIQDRSRASFAPWFSEESMTF
eukprot:5459504-Amphidinium_carterae.1